MIKCAIFRIFVTVISVGTTVAPAYAQGEVVPAKENQARIMPSYSEKSEAAAQAVIENKTAVKEAMVTPEVKPIDLPGPVKPPVIDWSKINFPVLDYAYVDKEGYEVKIQSEKEVFTVSWEKMNSADPNGNSTKDSRPSPVLSVSKSFSLNIKTGIITAVDCVEVCSSKELNMKEHPKEYLWALKAMSEKVVEGIRQQKPRPGLVDLKLRTINRVLHAVIQHIQKRIIEIAVL